VTPKGQTSNLNTLTAQSRKELEMLFSINNRYNLITSR